MRYLYISLLVFASLPSIVKGQIITTVAGNGTAGYSGDGGQATDAEFYTPVGAIFDVAGNLYIADLDNNRVRKVNTAGIITTIAGNGMHGYSGDGGQATAAELYQPAGLALDASGNLYIDDFYNNVIRKINTLGIITTVAGNGTIGYTGDGGQATAAEFYGPSSITFDAAGNLYIADNGNNRIRKINTSGIISTIAGNGTGGYSGDGGQATAAELHFPYGETFDLAGNLYITDNLEVIRKIALNCSECAGIEQLSNTNEQVTIYPNPASASLTLTLSKGEGIVSVSIYDMLGKLVMQHTCFPPSEGQGEAIDVSDLNEGVYNISISGNGAVANKRVVIVR